MRKIKGGLLIVFEGGEGAGKTTQAKALTEFLKVNKGYDAEYFREPGGNELAENIRNLILYNKMDGITETLLFNAARRINIMDNILPKMENGGICVLDRFILSTYVYQHKLKGVSIKLINNLNSFILPALIKDRMLTIILTCDTEEAMKRAAAEGHERNKYDVADKEQYEMINKAYAEDPPNVLDNVRRIGTTNLSMEQVYDKITDCILEELEYYETYEVKE